jgi:peptidoglycan/LPS O-acetylase OafA/YrhL
MFNNAAFLINFFLLLVVAVSVLFGLAVYKWWERPLNRWCKSLKWLSPDIQCATTQQAP